MVSRENYPLGQCEGSGAVGTPGEKQENECDKVRLDEAGLLFKSKVLKSVILVSSVTVTTTYHNNISSRCEHEWSATDSM